MIKEEEKVILKDGSEAILRTPNLNEGEILLNFTRLASGETEFLLKNSEEWDNVTVESENAWIEEKRNSANTLVIGCYVDGKIAGNCDVMFRGGKKAGHRCTIGIAILKEYWNKGIGTILIGELIKSAKEYGSEIMELEFIEGNERARRLYEKCGFKVIGERPNAFKVKDGTYRKEYLMQKYLKEDKDK